MFSAAKGYFYRQYLVHRKNKAEKAWIFVYPLVGLFSIGILALYLKAVGAPLNVVPFVLVGVTAWAFYDLCQKAMVYGVLFDVWDHCMKNSVVSPAGEGDYILGNALFGLASGAISIVLLNAFAIYFFGVNMFLAGTAFIAALAIIFIFATSVGLAINSAIVGFDKEYMALMWSVPGIIMVFSGVYYPVSILPEVVRGISYALPTTYAIDVMRIALGFSEGIVWQEALKGFFASAIYFVIFLAAYKASLGRARKTGRTILE